MSYPKPLSEKTLTRMYKEANIDEKASEFFHQFFLAAMNLYGTINLRDLWQVCLEVRGKYGMGRIHKKDMIAFSSIARREEVPYYVYEIDELYKAEPRAMLDRQIVRKDIIIPHLRYRSKFYFYALDENQMNKPYYVPQDFLSYAEPMISKPEEDLLAFLSSLKVTEKEYETRFGTRGVCEHTGERLGDFSFLNSAECFELEYYGGKTDFRKKANPKVIEALERNTAGTEAEKITRNYKWDCMIGQLDLTDNIQYVMDELNEVGVKLSDSQFEKLLQLMMNLNNKSNLWCNCGWSPTELGSTHRLGAPKITFGPGLQKAIADGNIDADELSAMAKKYGWSII